MPDLLLELFSEEIPARMQRRAAEDLQKLVTGALVDAGLSYEGAKGFATPRRLALTIAGLPVHSADMVEEKKGPRVGAPQAAIDGFLKSSGLASIEEAKIQSDPKKGDFYIAHAKKPGRATSEIVAEIMPRILKNFPWPKSMRWGEASKNPGAFTWVRPLHFILCLLSPETEEGEIVRFELDGIVSGDHTFGHRFMAGAPIKVRRFEDYVAKLEAAKVVLDADRRKDIILHDARDRAFALGLELVEDEGLLEEVAGLVEFPVVLAGSFDKEFLAIPQEVIRATIRANQKCFVARDPKTEKLSNRFFLVANIEASDGGKAIVGGNERVIRARLSDARHFWETDRKSLPAYRDSGLQPLDQRLQKLRDQNIVFHGKLGTQGKRVDRLMAMARDIALARDIARRVGADPEDAARAAELAKADLVSEMVGEFPELQGLMGKYYAEAQNEPASVALAIEEHYKPVGPSDSVPTDPVAIAVALADKIDILVGFWAIDEKPTGSKDPYALRRAALGIIRIILSNEIRIHLRPILVSASRAYMRQKSPAVIDGIARWGIQKLLTEDPLDVAVNEAIAKVLWVKSGVQEFLSERLKAQLREQGARHDLVDAVFALGDQDDLLLIVRRIEALAKFLDSEDGKNLLAGQKRAANILRAEEKGGESFAGEVEGRHLIEPAEIALASAVEAARTEAAKAVATEDFSAAMAALAKLRAPVDVFFDKVLVNAKEPEIRANRLRLLNRIRKATRTVADFSKVGG